MSLTLERLASRFPEQRDGLAAYIAFVEGCTSPTAGNYTERHHILPRSLFPELADAPWNLKALTGADHFLAHYWLFEALPDIPQVVYAWRILWANRFKQIPSALLREHAESYEASKKAWKRLRADWKPSAATRAKMSASAKTKVFTEEHRANMSRSKLGHAVSEETKRKIRDAQKGVPRGPRDPDAVRATADKLRGRKQTPEQIRAAQAGRAKNGPRVASEETKRKMREASALRWADPQQRKQAQESAKRRKTTPPPPSADEA